MKGMYLKVPVVGEVTVRYKELFLEEKWAKDLYHALPFDELLTADAAEGLLQAHSPMAGSGGFERALRALCGAGLVREIPGRYLSRVVEAYLEAEAEGRRKARGGW
jgi:hypothetical protein